MDRYLIRSNRSQSRAARGISPRRGRNTSAQGTALGEREHVRFPSLKGPNRVCPRQRIVTILGPAPGPGGVACRALSGLFCGDRGIPRALPWADLLRPLRGRDPPHPGPSRVVFGEKSPINPVTKDAHDATPVDCVLGIDLFRLGIGFPPIIILSCRLANSIRLKGRCGLPRRASGSPAAAPNQDPTVIIHRERVVLPAPVRPPEAASDPGEPPLIDAADPEGLPSSDQALVEPTRAGKECVARHIDTARHPNDANSITDTELPPRLVHGWDLPHSSGPVASSGADGFRRWCRRRRSGWRR